MTLRRIGAVLLALAAGGLWAASRLGWVTAEVDDELAGSASYTLTGSQWSLELTALALVLLAGSVAVFALRRLGRRIVGIMCAIGAVGASWSGLELVAGQPDPARAQNILQAAANNEIAVEAEGISQWATVASVEGHLAGPILVLAASAVALFAGVAVAMRPGHDTVTANKYERKASREETIAKDLQASPDSGRVMWDALDADIDPTVDKRSSSPGSTSSRRAE